MVDVGVGELRASRARLAARSALSEAAGDAATAGLLLFYAAECGLKAELLRQVHLARDTSALPKDLRTHDLRRLAKALNWPDPTGGPEPLRCRRHRGGEWVESQELHEAWRYGATLRAEDQKAALEALRVMVRKAERGC